ncbi:MAG: pseudouridine synthase [Candidatus Omnitrophota bacterium]
MKKRLQTVLSHAGVASRRRAVELIESGRVEVDGRIVTEKGFKLDPARHKVLVDGRPIRAEEEKYYFLLNKPKNVISTARDTHSRKKVTDFFKNVDARLYPVGRLDRDTTGALLITNDGQFAHKLAHPRFEIEKEYLVTVDKAPTGEEIKKLERGIYLYGKRTAPCKIGLVGKAENKAVLRVSLHEGRKRQIKRMFEEIGRKVVELKRAKYAGLTLGKLKEGEYRELTDSEVKRLKSLLRDPRPRFREDMLSRG